ncbi:MAG: hypothetical protein MHM6MM_008059, partial [Cercozoa sp. M6MM]
MLRCITCTAADNADVFDPPNTPVLALVNAKSGGRLGQMVLDDLRNMGAHAVSLLSLVSKDGEVRERATQEARDFLLSLDVTQRRRLRVLIGGGDGTASFGIAMLERICNEQLRRLGITADAIPIGLLPLGTGNDLSRASGWNNVLSYSIRNIHKRLTALVSIRSELVQLDHWHCRFLDDMDSLCGSCQDEPAEPESELSLPEPDDDIAILDSGSEEEPPQLHRSALNSSPRLSAQSAPGHLAVAPRAPPDSAPVGQRQQCAELLASKPTRRPDSFVCYLSLGYDAHVAHRFHERREIMPHKFTSPLRNKAQYMRLSLQEMRSQHPPINDRVEIYVTEGDKEERIELPAHTRSLKLININSAANGVYFWGNSTSTARADRVSEWTPPSMGDGRIEVMSTRGVWNHIKVRVKLGHAARLAQATRVRIRVLKPVAVQ